MLLLGVVAYARLPIASLPAVERPTIEVYAPFPGASADTVATSLAQPLERSSGSSPAWSRCRRYSGMGGASIVTPVRSLGQDVDAAAGAVQAAINAAGPDLPKDMRPPVYWKSNPAGFAVICAGADLRRACRRRGL